VIYSTLGTLLNIMLLTVQQSISVRSIYARRLTPRITMIYLPNIRPETFHCNYSTYWNYGSKSEIFHILNHNSNVEWEDYFPAFSSFLLVSGKDEFYRCSCLPFLAIILSMRSDAPTLVAMFILFVAPFSCM
jgi:hypothetical protein